MMDREAVLEEVWRIRPGGPGREEEQASGVRGGRSAAEVLLAAIRPEAYGRSRNYLDGAVTRLSPYVTHGVVTLAELRERALAAGRPVERIRQFVSELGWRDYYQRVWELLGERIWEDLEPYKTGLRAGLYAGELPVDVREGRTGLACVDALVRELIETGYLHNHARMWLAGYVVHWRRVGWQAGARWFLEHLLDGDEASNNLSWQWVASTFSHKPYIFNRENVERYSAGRWCVTCPIRGGCDFEGSYENIEHKLFQEDDAVAESEAWEGDVRLWCGPDGAEADGDSADLGRHGVVWIHARNLNPKSRLLQRCAGLPAVWVWDEGAGVYADWSLKRWVFVGECVSELPVERVTGQAVEAIGDFARRRGARTIWTSATPVPSIRRTIAQLRGEFDVRILAEPGFVRLERGVDLKRFSRYWRVAEKRIFGGLESV